jgi:hypothetical protein
VTPCPRLLTLLLLLAAPSAAQQADTLSTSSGILVVTSDPESAWVYRDTSFAGRTPLTLQVPAPATLRLRILHPDAANWLTEAVLDTVHLIPGEEARRHHDIPRWTMIVTIPSGAEVFSGDSLIGTTPYALRPADQPGAGSVTVRKAGYGTATGSLALASRGVLLIPLVPSGEPAGSNDWRLGINGAGRASSLPLWVAGGSAVVFGSFAAYYKIQADHQQNEFLRTGNPYHQAERARMDDLSALYFLAAQIGLGVFIAFLVSD